MALRNQIISVIKADYLQPIRNIHMDMMNETIPDIINFLSKLPPLKVYLTKYRIFKTFV